MSEYQITFSRSAEKELEALSTEVVSRIYPKIEALAVEPRPEGCKKLKGQQNRWRIRWEIIELSIVLMMIFESSKSI